MVKNLLAMWETQVQSLGQEDPREKGLSSHSSILAWRVPWTEATVYGVAKSQVFKRKKKIIFLLSLIKSILFLHYSVTYVFHRNFVRLTMEINKTRITNNTK